MKVTAEPSTAAQRDTVVRCRRNSRFVVDFTEAARAQTRRVVRDEHGPFRDPGSSDMLKRCDPLKRSTRTAFSSQSVRSICARGIASR